MEHALALSTGALVVGPAVAAAGRRWSTARASFDGFVVVTIAGLVLAHILPHSFALAGVVSLAPAAIGLAVPALIHRWLHHRHEATSAFGLALLALVVHALLDGVALAGGASHHAAGSKLGAAIVLHRVPLAIAIWWVVGPALGVWAAWTTLGAVAAATMVGHTLAGGALADASGFGLGLFQALMAGSLLHVGIHHRTDTDGGGGVAAALPGVALATAFLLALGLAEARSWSDFEGSGTAVAVTLVVAVVYCAALARRRGS